jgi:predicted 3-demethylubiquinone-9 3-methyltransferase (glyoxalase superfamily)
MQKITPFLWFDNNAEEAMQFYMSIFKDARVVNIMCNRAGAPGPEGTVLSVTFRLLGREFIALNGGPHYQFSPAISMFVSCETQNEVDELWDRLSVGGEPNRCGWLTDKYGLCWQIVPTVLGEMLQDEDTERAGRVMQAMLKMVKLDIGVLRQAYEQQ